MPLTRILKKGGPQARLSISGMAFLACISLPGSLCAMENPLQSLLELDYGRQIWMPSEAPASPIDPMPGDSLFAFPEFSASVSFDYLDLIRKSGSFAFDHSESIASLALTTAAIPHLEIRFTAEGSRRDLDIGDPSARFDNGGRTWEWEGSVAYLFTPWLVPTLRFGGDSHDHHGNDLKALSLKGAAAGWEWALGLGDKHLDQPSTLDLKGYDRISLPIQVRREFRDLAFGYHRGPWRADAAGHWTRLRYPAIRLEGYGLADSGSTWKYSAAAAYDRLRQGGGYRASLDFDVGYGRHAFQGADRKGETLRTFSRQIGEQKSYSIRADLRTARAAWEWGAYAGAGELELDALRPDVAFDNYLWDRNGAIDSYQGGLLGVFDDETWLFNGAVYLGQAGGGLWSEKTWAGWRGRLGLGYEYLVLESQSHLTDRQTTFLFAYREETSDRIYPRIRADVLTPELRLEKSWGPVYAAASGAQALPVRVRVDGDSGGGSGGSRKRSQYSGGTKARVELGWRLP